MPRSFRIALAVIVCTTTIVAALAVATPASGSGDRHVPRRELAAVRRATAKFHRVDVAERAGYELLDVCFDSPDGGMGIHYLKGVDDKLDARRPEALVYELTERGPKLVAVEYIVPLELKSSPPKVLGQRLHANHELGLWVLHAWIWRYNPSGVFADYNPRVAPCPDGS